MLKPIKYGLAGSIHEKVEAMPLLPAISAKTGVMQHNEAAIADSTPAPNSDPDALLSFIRLLV